MGTRFGHYTDLVPKGFVSIGDKPMILRSIEVLLSCGITRIVIGTGYRCEVYEELKKDYPMIETCFSPLYAETNSSLLDCAFSDVMLITPVTKFQDQYYVEYDSEHTLTNCSVNKDDVDVKGELVGIHKLSHAFYDKMCRDYEVILSEQPKLGYEYELLRMSRSVSPVYVLNVPGLKWYEIDDESDLLYAEQYVFPYCR